MIGEDPYTLGLFDTAGKRTIFVSPSFGVQPGFLLTSRSGGLRPSAPTILSPDGRLPGMLQCNIPCILRERQGEVVPRSTPPLSRRPMPHRGDTDRSAGRYPGDR